MIFTKKINLKLAIIGITFMSLLIITNSVLMEFGLQKSVELTYSTHYEETKKIINNKFELLKDLANILAKDKNIIDTLDFNRSVDEIDEKRIRNSFNEVSYFKEYLNDLIFINSASIASIQGKYLICEGKIIPNYDVILNGELRGIEFKNENDIFISDINKHIDKNTDKNMDEHINTAKYEVLIARPIYSDKNNELLGIVILEVFIEDLIKEINSGFYMGQLDTYIKIKDNEYLCKDGIVNSISKDKDDYIIKLNSKFGDKLPIFLKYDKEAIIYNREMRVINSFRTLIFSALGIIYLIILILLMKATFKPILQSLNKLKILFRNLESKEIDFEKMDEFEQLELVSSSLGTSFDKKIKSLIYYDELTKLPNRKLLSKLCNDLIQCNNEFALIFVDLNKFKYINDVFGHSAGDEVLFNFSRRLEACLNNKGTVTRYSGDEFIIIYSDYEDNNELISFYNEVILEEFKEPIIFNNGKKLFIDFAAGVSVYPKDASNFNDLIDKSDFMMYSSKKGKNKDLLFFNDVIYNDILRIERIKEALKLAIDNNEFVLFYQPIVDKNKSINKLEALIRWNNKDLGFIEPGDFIEYTEESGDIVKIGYWIIEEVCRNFNELFNCGYKLQISINVSPIQLMEVEFIDKIDKILDKYNVSWENLCFEITESVVLDENIIIHNNLLLLNERGVKIALDDFGTGYASFSYLKKFKLDILKIDRIFIDNGSHVDFKIVNNIKNIAHLLEMETVIEGVETEGQFEVLSDVGCDYFQGYHFSRPLPLSEIREILFGMPFHTHLDTPQGHGESYMDDFIDDSGEK